MAGKFVLDQCVIIKALEGQIDCLQAIHAIIERCDSIVYNERWMNNCYSEIRRHGGTIYGRILQRLLENSFTYTGKLLQEIKNPPQLPDELSIHNDDLWHVRLAVASQATEVTIDEPLIETLRKKNISCLRPEEVTGT